MDKVNEQLQVPVKKIVVLDQVRKTFDPIKMAEMVKSVTKWGVIEPIVLRPKDGKLVLVSGERRLRAATEAGVLNVPAVIKDYTDEQAAEVQIVENFQREDLNPIEEARGLSTLLGYKGETTFTAQKLLPPAEWTAKVKDVSARTGKSVAHISRVLRLLELPAKTLEWIKNGDLLVEHGYLMLTAPPDFWPAVEQRLKEMIASHKGKYSDGKHDRTITVSDLERYLDDKIAKDLRNAPFPTNKPYAGTVACNVCPFNTACQASLLPGLEGGGTCRQPACWQKKRDTVYLEIRDAQVKRKEVEGLQFSGFGRVGYNGKTLPDAIRGMQVVELNKLTPEMKKAMADKDKRQAFGWGIVKPLNDSAKPQVTVVYVIKKPELLSKVKGVQKKAEKKETNYQGKTVEQRQAEEFARRVSHALEDHEAVQMLPLLMKVKTGISAGLSWFISDDDRASIYEAAVKTGLKKNEKERDILNIFNRLEDEDAARLLLAAAVLKNESWQKPREKILGLKINDVMTKYSKQIIKAQAVVAPKIKTDTYNCHMTEEQVSDALKLILEDDGKGKA